MNVIEDNPFATGWEQLGKMFPRPKAIVSISAHWETVGTRVTAMEAPRTIHDFGNFPQALFDIQYPAKGDSALAARIQSLINTAEVTLDHQWGLDRWDLGGFGQNVPGCGYPGASGEFGQRVDAERSLRHR